MKASAVIPAYNEERTIEDVVRVALNSPYIAEVIVVSDGSTDATAEVARNAGAVVLELSFNVGKGGAMMVGFNATHENAILFLDADLIGLRPEHIKELLVPVLSQAADMTIGVFDRGRIATDLAQAIAPYLSGQRAVTRKVLDEISNLDITRFGVEVALTRFAEDKDLKVREVVLADLSHVMKEEKLGIMKGFAARMKMYWEIAKYVKGG